jgi:adenosylhomocysteine nucleosidase
MVRKRLIRTSWLLGLLALAAWVATAAAQQPTAILCAIDEEAAVLRERLESPEELPLHGHTFLRGRLAGRPVILAVSGVGKVNAAMTATLLLTHFEPREVLFTGIAGGLHPELGPGDIVIAGRTVQHDVVSIRSDTLITFAPRSPVTRERPPIHTPADERLHALALFAAHRLELDSLTTSAGRRLPRVVSGTVATGDCFVASSAKKAEIRARVAADAVEMEGAAVAQVCREFETPCLIIRSLSDRADERAGEDVMRFYEIAAANSTRLVLAILELMAGK